MEPILKAIVYSQHGLPINDPHSLYETDLPIPQPGLRDLLVKVRAVAVNPVDTKVRRGAPTPEPRVLGWDAVGTVESVGVDVTLFQPGDEVFYAGVIDRPGSYAEYSLVDERIVGHAPRSISHAEAAALPLTSITAWELLFDRLGIAESGGAGQTLLVVGAAGGVGSILVQLARQLTQLRVIGTASRPETREWLLGLGAHAVIDHTLPLFDELQRQGIHEVDLVASLTQTDQHFTQLVAALKPQGKLALIDDPVKLDVMPLKRKSISLHWELMFTRPLFKTPDMGRQHEILERVSQLVDAGTIKTTLAEHFGRVSAENLRSAHVLVESGKARGKIVLEGF
jgi:zinc-binding alcohol dehydrogenase family protein